MLGTLILTPSFMVNLKILRIMACFNSPIRGKCISRSIRKKLGKSTEDSIVEKVSAKELKTEKIKALILFIGPKELLQHRPKLLKTFITRSQCQDWFRTILTQLMLEKHLDSILREIKTSLTAFCPNCKPETSAVFPDNILWSKKRSS
jgi:hypothetical protein